MSSLSHLINTHVYCTFLNGILRRGLESFYRWCECHVKNPKANLQFFLHIVHNRFVQILVLFHAFVCVSDQVTKMWLLKRITLKLMLKLTVVVVSMGILVVLRHTTSWRNTYIFSYSWLEITDTDGNMDAVCNCSAILLRDQEEIEKVKMLAIRRDFQKTIEVPDEYYVNVTRDCRSVLA